MMNTAYETLFSNTNIMDVVKNGDLIEKIRSFPYQNTIDVTAELRNRLDLISYREYNGVTYLWWYIAIYNNIIDPFKFDNPYLYIPDFNSLQTLMVDNLIQRNSL